MGLRSWWARNISIPSRELPEHLEPPLPPPVPPHCRGSREITVLAERELRDNVLRINSVLATVDRQGQTHDRPSSTSEIARLADFLMREYRDEPGRFTLESAVDVAIRLLSQPAVRKAIDAQRAADIADVVRRLHAKD